MYLNHRTVGIVQRSKSMEVFFGTHLQEDLFWERIHWALLCPQREKVHFRMEKPYSMTRVKKEFETTELTLGDSSDSDGAKTLDELEMVGEN